MSSTPPLPLARFSPDALDFAEVQALFERCASTRLGRRVVRELAPIDDAAVGRRYARFDEVAALEREGRGPSLGGLSDPLFAIAILREERRPLLGEEVAELAQILAASERLRAWLFERDAATPALGALATEVPRLSAELAELERICDEKGNVRDEASPRLAGLRRAVRDLERTVESRLSTLIGRAGVRPHLSDPHPHRRGGRAVLAVKALSAGRVPGIVHDRSQSRETVFIEPHEVVEVQNRLHEARRDEGTEVTRVLTALGREISSWEERLGRAAGALAELELAVLCGVFAKEHGARAPQVVASGAADGRAGGGLALFDAVHPLLVQAEREGRIERAVPIDVRLGEDFDLLVVTGPNTGGKTLALKTLGLAALCARLGLPVVCGPRSRVPLYTSIAADVGDEQEVRQNLSTFASHLVRIKAGLEHADRRSLVLFDELGGGTDPDDGAALGEAVLARLLSRGVPTFATTHLGRLKEFAYRNKRVQNACVEFDPVSLEPRYRLLIGVPGESSALAIARRLGLDPAICDDAEARRVRRDDEVQELMTEMRGARAHAEQARRLLDARLAQLDERADGLAREAADLERRGAELESEGQRDLEQRVREAKDQLDPLRALAAQCPGAVQAELRERLARLEAVLSGAVASERRERYLASLAKGQFVYVPRLGKRGVIAKVDRGRGRVLVRLGRVPIEVSFDELSAYAGP